MSTRFARPASLTAALLLAAALGQSAGCSSDESSRVEQSSSYSRPVEPAAYGVGSERAEVESQLGTFISSVPLDNGGRIDVYEYETSRFSSPQGAQSSEGYSEDLWRPAWMPREASRSGYERIAIVYNGSDRVVAMNLGAPARDAERADAGDE